MSLQLDHMPARSGLENGDEHHNTVTEL